MKTPLYCLTLHRPWGYAIAYLGKDVENRGHPCNLPLGTFIAIHHGKKWDDSALAAIEALKNQGLIKPNSSLPNPNNCPPSEIVAIAQFAGCLEHSDSPWFYGPYGWALTNILAIDPVHPVKGKQGFWRPEPMHLVELRDKYLRAGRVA